MTADTATRGLCPFTIFHANVSSPPGPAASVPGASLDAAALGAAALVAGSEAAAEAAALVLSPSAGFDEHPTRLAATRMNVNGMRESEASM
jgi:hypothetical protein